MEPLKKIFRRIYGIYRIVFHGAGQDILKPKPIGKKAIDSLNWLDYFVLTSLDWLDTRVFFKNRKVRTSKGRVRSRVERNLVRFFDRHGIIYIYEQPLILEGKKFLPDFYLPDYKVYVEVLGLYNTDVRYRKTARLKKKLYLEHSIPVISLYPRHLKNLEKVFPVLFQETTDRSFPCQQE